MKNPNSLQSLVTTTLVTSQN